MKIVIDDQYHNDDSDYGEQEYTVDENGNLNLFIQVDEEIEKETSSRTINRGNIINNQAEGKIIENNFNEDFLVDEKYADSDVYDNLYSQIGKAKEEFVDRNIVEEKGTIQVTSRLANKDGVELKGARINLYLLNGISPKLYDSKFTDSNGKAIFSNLENGCYRVIAIVDRRFFEKPSYYSWNEVTIDKNNKYADICVVNRIKMSYYRR